MSQFTTILSELTTNTRLSKTKTIQIQYAGDGFDIIDINIDTRDTADDIYSKIRDATNESHFCILDTNGRRLQLVYGDLKSGRPLRFENEKDPTVDTPSPAKRKVKVLLPQVLKCWGLSKVSEILPLKFWPRELTTCGPSTDKENFRFQDPWRWSRLFVKALHTLAMATIGKHKEALELVEMVARKRKKPEASNYRQSVAYITADLRQALRISEDSDGRRSTLTKKHIDDETDRRRNRQRKTQDEASAGISLLMSFRKRMQWRSEQCRPCSPGSSSVSVIVCLHEQHKGGFM
ncbi:hypothetical protein K505DRAFT_376351 [Melanomma pulvis-pyrius CBS 109.77]|uniref:Uncharacterized protein n=1 Tax=Melanomma pulvis-pyrius CBS 109.77 TaxID=1314802 RepID=A0A6A6X6X9_9PLEO|nr:hypothetical protein K505DRAFT_376351 [Melanomma pulvis-pyrius CBS 109.77]